MTKVEERAVWYWQDRLAKFFPTSPGPTTTEIEMFRAGFEAGVASVICDVINEDTRGVDED